MANANGSDRSVTIAEFLKLAPADLPIKTLGGESGLAEKALSSHRLQKLGLALAGFPDYIHKDRIQNIGQSEISYLTQLGAKGRSDAVARLDPDRISSILLTKGLEPPPELIAFCNANGIPLLQTSLVSSKAITAISRHLESLLAPETTLHAVAMELHGIGVLMIGPSGIGKSECALDLITRGHRLVADDAVKVKRIDGRIEASAPELTREHLELHGLGILNIREMFGFSAICERSCIELCIELQKWNEIETIERIGLEMLRHELFGVELPKYVLPVSSGRNLATIVDTAVRKFLLRSAGFDSASKLVERHAEMLTEKKQAG